ncbi:bacteriophage holin [Candidatus Omnitrophota bacterium]
MKFNVKAFALTCGILWGLGVFFLAWWIILFDGATGEVTMIGRIYRGFTITPLGSLVGLAWGFCDGFIGGALFALIYNKLCPDSKNSA